MSRKCHAYIQQPKDLEARKTSVLYKVILKTEDGEILDLQEVTSADVIFHPYAKIQTQFIVNSFIITEGEM